MCSRTNVVSLSALFMSTAGLLTGEKQSVKMSHSIMRASPESLGSAAAKITYLGPQEKPIRTVMFSTVGNEVPSDRFADFQYGRRHYQNDVDANIDRFSVTPIEFHRILTALRNVVKTSEGERPTFLSFTVITKSDGNFQGAEFHIQQVAASGFYKVLRNALDPQNEAGRDILATQERNILPHE